MEKKMKRIFGLVVVSMITALVLVITAIAAAPPKGPSPGAPNVIHWLVFGDFSGPYAATVGPGRIGTLHAIEYINMHGGIAGVQVKPLIYDCGGKVDIAVAQFAEAVAKKPKPIMGTYWISMVGEALHDRFIEDGLVMLGSASMESIYPRGATVSQYPLYADSFAAWADWVVTQTKKPVKLGIITGNTTYGKAILYPQNYEYLKKKGIECVGTEMFGPRDIDMTTQITKLKNAGANWLYCNYTGLPVTAILRNCKEMGWNVPLCGADGFDYGTALIDPNVCEGHYSVLSYAHWGEPALNWIKEIADSRGTPLTERSQFYIMAWNDLFVAKTIIEKVVKEKGWKQVNQKNVLRTLLNWSGSTPEGVHYQKWFPPYTYHPNKTRICQFQGKTRETLKIIPITGWLDAPDVTKGHPLREKPPMVAID